MNGENIQRPNQYVEKALTYKDNKSKKFFKALLDKLEIFLVVIIGVLYVLQGLFTLSKSGKSWQDILGGIAESFLVGFMIYTSLRRMGLRMGRKDDRFLESLDLYADTKAQTRDYREKTPAFCVYKNIQEVESAKREYLEDNGLNYTLWKYGKYTKEMVDRLELDEQQKKCLDNVANIKIQRLKPNELYSDLPHLSKRQLKKYGRFGLDEKHYQAQNGMKDIMFMVFGALLSGYFILQPIITKDSLANVLWNAVQLSVWVAFGIGKYYQSYMFMINDYRQSHIIQKTEILNEFISIMSKNPKALDEYDEELKYLKELEKIEQEKEEKKESVDNEL